MWDEPLAAHSYFSEDDTKETVEMMAYPSCVDLNFKKLENEHSKLNNSLISLTTHFAQVQLRLKQILQANMSDKEEMLKDLETFASKGCLDFQAIKGNVYPSYAKENGANTLLSAGQGICQLASASENSMLNLAAQKERQKQLITQLKMQLRELETDAYESGTIEELPQDLVIEKQKLVLEELNAKLQLDYDIEHMSPVQLKQAVDYAIHNFVNPFQIKEKLVTQLKTQIIDLERYVEYLQSAELQNDIKQSKPCTCVCPRHDNSDQKFNFKSSTQSNSENSLMAKAMNLFGLFVLSFFDYENEKRFKAAAQNLYYSSTVDNYSSKSNSNSKDAHLNSSSTTTIVNNNVMVMLPTYLGSSILPQGNHWGNARANFEIAVSSLLNVCRMNKIKCETAARHRSIELAREHRRRYCPDSFKKDRTGPRLSDGFSSTLSDSDYTTKSEDDDSMDEDETYATDEIASNTGTAKNHTNILENTNSCKNDPKIAAKAQKQRAYNHYDNLIQPSCFGESSSEDDSDEEGKNLLWDENVVECVRNEFAPRLLELLHHGYIDAKMKPSGGINPTTSLITSYLSCFAASPYGAIPPTHDSPSGPDHNEDYDHLITKTRKSFFGFNNLREEPHFWDAILTYYEIKGGPQFNQSASKKLSRSFDLDIVGHTKITPKAKLLSTVHDIILAHQPLKRSKDALYKAFVSHGLNQKLLVHWLRLILRSKHIVIHFYQSWSYVSKTGFEDALQSMEKLIDECEFSLPVDLAIIHLKRMKDAF